MQKHITTFLATSLPLAAFVSPSSAQSLEENFPVSTKWTLDAAGPTQRTAIKSVLMLLCQKADSKGTGFILRGGTVVTAAHVVAGCMASDVIGTSAAGKEVRFTKVIPDPKRDLALLRPATALSDGLELAPNKDPDVGAGVATWGFPFGYNGPAPLLSVGYVAGYINSGTPAATVKHLVVNGAFNPGNSGGPLFQSGGNTVIGIVVSKFAPMTPAIASALQALANNPSGFSYTATDEAGNKKNVSEAQVVAEILLFYRSLTQVMIGEAVSVSELRSFLSEKQTELK